MMTMANLYGCYRRFKLNNAKARRDVLSRRRSAVHDLQDKARELGSYVASENEKLATFPSDGPTRDEKSIYDETRAKLVEFGYNDDGAHDGAMSVVLSGRNGLRDSIQVQRRILEDYARRLRYAKNLRNIRGAVSTVKLLDGESNLLRRGRPGAVFYDCFGVDSERIFFEHEQQLKRKFGLIDEDGKSFVSETLSRYFN